MPNLETVAAAHRSATARYTELERNRAMSAGVYVIPPGAPDPQRPHLEDELYLVVRGHGVFHQGTQARPVGPGELLFVPAREPHRFSEVDQELVLLVVFAPPETVSGGGSK